jgi:hypothetical protein
MVSKTIRCPDEVWKRFRALCSAQGRKQGSMLMELLDSYEMYHDPDGRHRGTALFEELTKHIKK